MPEGGLEPPTPRL